MTLVLYRHMTLYKYNVLHKNRYYRTYLSGPIFLYLKFKFVCKMFACNQVQNSLYNIHMYVFQIVFMYSIFTKVFQFQHGSWLRLLLNKIGKHIKKIQNLIFFLSVMKESSSITKKRWPIKFFFTNTLLRPLYK